MSSKIYIVFFIFILNVTLLDLPSVCAVNPESRSYARSSYKLELIRHQDRDIPESFDARERWKFCESIGTVRNMGACNASWAFVAASVMSDRICIESQGKKKVEISPMELLTCCETCTRGFRMCQGGNVQSAWTHWINKGLTTGGDYNSGGCFPYSANYLNFQRKSQPEPCKSDCDRDKHYGRTAYRVPENKVRQAQIEIMQHGPIQVAIREYYRSFQEYKGGIYTDSGEDYEASIGLIFVRIVGWGQDNNVSYWIGSATFGTNWGEKGFFKFLKDANHCGIEEIFIGGQVKHANCGSNISVHEIIIPFVIFGSMFVERVMIKLFL